MAGRPLPPARAPATGRAPSAHEPPGRVFVERFAAGPGRGAGALGPARDDAVRARAAHSAAREPWLAAHDPVARGTWSCRRGAHACRSAGPRSNAGACVYPQSVERARIARLHRQPHGGQWGVHSTPRRVRCCCAMPAACRVEASRLERSRLRLVRECRDLGARCGRSCGRSRRAHVLCAAALSGAPHRFRHFDPPSLRVVPRHHGLCERSRRRGSPERGGAARNATVNTRAIARIIADVSPRQSAGSARTNIGSLAALAPRLEGIRAHVHAGQRSSRFCPRSSRGPETAA